MGAWTGINQVLKPVLDSVQRVPIDFALTTSSRILLLLTLEILNPFNLEPAAAQTPPFYQGKTITMIVGTQPAGDVYDLYPRLLVEYMTKYIPGNPNIIIQNVAGAASLIAANQVYSVAKPDGLTLGAIYPALYFDQLVKRPESKIRLE